MTYLATPYSSPFPDIVRCRFEEACRIAGYLMDRGEVIFCPIAHMHSIAASYDLPRDKEFIKLSSKMIVAMMSGWKTSKGVQAEIKMARELGIPVEYMEVES